jgi:hypothetical protein
VGSGLIELTGVMAVSSVFPLNRLDPQNGQFLARIGDHRNISVEIFAILILNGNLLPFI